MSQTLQNRKRLRKTFQRNDQIAEMPNLIEVQKFSYELFYRDLFLAKIDLIKVLKMFFVQSFR